MNEVAASRVPRVTARSRDSQLSSVRFGIKRLAAPVVPGFLVRDVLPDVTGDRLSLSLPLLLLRARARALPLTATLSTAGVSPYTPQNRLPRIAVSYSTKAPSRDVPRRESGDMHTSYSTTHTLTLRSLDLDAIRAKSSETDGLNSSVPATIKTKKTRKSRRGQIPDSPDSAPRHGQEERIVIIIIIKARPSNRQTRRHESRMKRKTKPS